MGVIGSARVVASDLFVFFQAMGVRGETELTALSDVFCGYAHAQLESVRDAVMSAALGKDDAHVLHEMAEALVGAFAAQTSWGHCAVDALVQVRFPNFIPHTIFEPEENRWNSM